MKDEEDGSRIGHSPAGAQTASVGEDPPHSVRRPPNGDGNARGAEAPPPLPRVVLRGNLRHAVTRHPAQQPAVAYIH